MNNAIEFDYVSKCFYLFQINFNSHASSFVLSSYIYLLILAQGYFFIGF